MQMCSCLQAICTPTFPLVQGSNPGTIDILITNSFLGELYVLFSAAGYMLVVLPT